MFVELVPGQDGLVHISMIPRSKQTNLVQEFPIDSDLTVEVVDYDSFTGRIRLKLVD